MLILHHRFNGLRNKNLRSIQDVMRASDPAAEKYKRFCEDFPNIAILTKSATPVKIQLHTAEALRPVVAAQRDAEKETKGWNRLPPTDQRVILEASATTGTSIPTSPPSAIHRLLNARNTTALQAD